jgi:NADPH-dependent 2,4-dienoyl-CoA reductase/sulfur reductase-like enzyme/rhodanese-related sulfurtransferase
MSRAVLIVGASAAGLRCACRLKRLRPSWQVSVVEASEVFSYAACGLPYVLGGEIGEAAALRATTYGALRDERFFLEEKGVEVLTGWRATRIDADGGKLTVGREGHERRLSWDELVLATGARARRLAGQPENPRVRTFHRFEDLEPLKQGLAEGKIGNVAIIGAGLVGCELAEAFRGLWGAEVTLLEAAESVLPGVLDPELAACVAAHLQDQGVTVRCGTPVRRIAPDDVAVEVTAGDETASVDAVVVAVGVEPDVQLALTAGVQLGSTGAIGVDERLATNVPHVWAVGDCVEVRDAATGAWCHRPLGSLANRQGRTLANILAGREDRFPRVAGAVAVKAFDFNVAAVGWTASAAARRGLAARSVWITAEDRAHYWPEAALLHLKLVYEAETLRVLGVQAAGRGDTVKRIDVATQVISAGGSIQDLAHLEHAYAPPYAPAVEPLAVAAWVALNQEDGVEADDPLSELHAVMDVRQPQERQRRPAPATQVTEAAIGSLRSAKRAPESGLVLVCERGTRAAETARLLLGRGGHAHYLGGGLQWRAAAGPR